MLAPVYSTLPLNIIKASGCSLFDDQGREYLDFYGGHGVISLGHRNQSWLHAINQSLSSIPFYTNVLQHPMRDALADKLGKINSGIGYQVFFCNTGAEANENALKLAVGHSRRSKVVAVTNSFHGRSSAAWHVTDSVKNAADLSTGMTVVFVDANDVNALRAAVTAETAAVIVEAVQGVGGGVELCSKFLRTAESLTKKFGAFLIADEVQCGWGRTGDFFAFRQAGINPDFISMAKGMGNGYPVAGLLVTKKIALKLGELGTTYGGHPTAIAAANSVFEVLGKGAYLAQVRTFSEQVRDHLKSLHHVKEVRGRGYMLAVKFNRLSASTAKRILMEEHNIVVGISPKADVIRLIPPLSMSWSQWSRLIKAIASLDKKTQKDQVALHGVSL